MLNTGFALLNLKIGNTWWAFWPLLASGFLLALHYLGYKSFTLDDAWVDERTQELNLKSYDRSHIEDLKSRHEQK
ncbi:MAG: 2TM domain-containing protein [Sphingomonadales bacterium]|nr:2TM domain-containing protein [Sphingomonadales bacterium]